MRLQQLVKPYKLQGRGRFLIAAEDRDNPFEGGCLIRESDSRYRLAFDMGEIDVRFEFVAFPDELAVDVANVLLEMFDNGLPDMTAVGMAYSKRHTRPMP